MSSERWLVGAAAAAVAILLLLAWPQPLPHEPAVPSGPVPSVAEPIAVSAASALAASEAAVRRLVMAPVRVAVVDERGNPVADTEVYAVARCAVASDGVRESRTDRQGIAELALPPAPEHWLLFANWRTRTHPALSRGALEVVVRDDTAREVTLILGSLCARLVVQVRDDTGRPLRGIHVVPNHDDDFAETDHLGIARFDRLPAGSRPIDVLPGSGPTDLAFGGVSRQAIALARDECRELLFTLPRLGALHVRLSDPSQVPVAVELLGATANRALALSEVVVDADGTARFSALIPGRYRVAARFAASSTAYCPLHEEVLVEAGETTEFTLRVESMAGALRGRIVDAASRPVHNAPVRVRSARRGDTPALEKLALSDEAGYFEIRGLPIGDVECAVLVDTIPDTNYRHLGGDVPWIALVSPAEGVVLRLEPGHCVAGRVVDREGRPLGSQIVHLQRVGFPVDLRVTTADRDGRELPAREPGSFKFAHLAPGRYDLWVGEAPAGVQRLEVGAGPLAPVTLIAGRTP